MGHDASLADYDPRSADHDPSRAGDSPCLAGKVFFGVGLSQKCPYLTNLGVFLTFLAKVWV
jgi:hypothetical protein